MKFNINDNVRVKLTDFGRSVHKLNSEDVWQVDGEAWPSYFYKAPDEDSEGWSVWQLRVLMQEFGKYKGQCGPACFNTEIEIVEKNE